jgi:hypothetical protein
MKSHRTIPLLCLLVILALAACKSTPPVETAPDPTATSQTSASPVAEATPPNDASPTPPAEAQGGTEYVNPVLGLRMTVPEGLRVVEPEFLFPDTHGFTLVDEQGSLVLKVDWLRTAPDQDVGQAAQRLIDQYPGAAIRLERTAVLETPTALLFPVPGRTENTYLYTAANDRLYQIIYGQGQLDERGVALLESLQFEPPTQSLDSLGLPADESSAPTEAVEPTRTAMPEATAPATPATSIPNGWVAHELADVGTRVAIPAEWTLGRQPGLYLLGTGEGMEEQWLYIGSLSDAPQDIIALTAFLTGLWEEQGAAGFTVNPITIGGQEGVILEGLPNTCREIYVPVAGFVHQISVTSLACQGASDLNPVAQLVLDNISFFPPTP